MAEDPPQLTGTILREAARRLKLSQADIAKAAGVSTRTISRMFQTDGPIDARASTLLPIARILGLAEGETSDRFQPTVTFDLPLESLITLKDKLPLLFTLYELSTRTRSKVELLEALNAIDPTRVSSVSLRDNDLYFDKIGEGIRWGGDQSKNVRVADVGEVSIVRAATERYWRAIITGQPIFQYIRSTLTTEFVALSVGVDRHTENPGIVTASALGRYILP